MRQAQADDLDLVARWTRDVRAKLRDGLPGRLGFRVRVTFGFWLAALLGSTAGQHPKPALGLAILGMLFVFELPGALLARVTGRAVRIGVRVTGSDTEISGPTLSVVTRLAHALFGCAASLASGLAALALARAMHLPGLTEAGRLQLFWGVAQLLPLSPFKLGSLLKEQIGHWARVKQAVASLGLAVATVVHIVDRLEVPLILVACGIWLFVCVRELLDSVARARDVALSAEASLAEIAALTLGDQPERAMRMARTLLDSARSARLRTQAAVAFAWAAIGAGDVEQARVVMARVAARDADAHLLAAYLAATNRSRKASAVLELAHEHGARSVESLKLLADLYYRDAQRAKLSALLDSAADLLSAAELSSIKQALEQPVSKSDSARPGPISTRHFRHAF